MCSLPIAHVSWHGEGTATLCLYFGRNRLQISNSACHQSNGERASRIA
jgi:hypothetical protein